MNKSVWYCWACRKYSRELSRDVCEHCGGVRPSTTEMLTMRTAEAERQIKALRKWAATRGINWNTGEEETPT